MFAFGVSGIVSVVVGWVQPTSPKALLLGGLRFADPPCEKANTSLWDVALFHFCLVLKPIFWSAASTALR
jgi:hypothetical protein